MLNTQKKISARVELDDYTNRVLNIIKIKHGLNDKSQAINKFVEIYGDEVVEKEPTEEYVKKVLKIAEIILRNMGKKKRPLKNWTD